MSPARVVADFLPSSGENTRDDFELMFWSTAAEALTDPMITRRWGPMSKRWG